MKIFFSLFRLWVFSRFFFLKIVLRVFGFLCVSFLAVCVCVCEQKSTIVYFLVTITLKISDVCANKVNEQKDTRFFIIDSFERNVLYDGVLIKRKRNSIVKYGTQIV
jgi:hypothetical protein